jgi:DNA-binding NarL/FixJ family response regulator
MISGAGPGGADRAAGGHRRRGGLILDNEPDLTVVAEASDGAEALDKARTEQPDLAIIWIHGRDAQTYRPHDGPSIRRAHAGLLPRAGRPMLSLPGG